MKMYENWATKQCIELDKFCDNLDSEIWRETLDFQNRFTDYGNKIVASAGVKLGGGGCFPFLYFICRLRKPLTVVETGVAAGWTSLAILRALKKNGTGFLYSSDFPYFRLKNPEKYIGCLAKNESNVSNWFLDIRGDEVALPEIARRLENKSIDLFHYDSDKSYSGRSNALKILGSKINSNTIIIFDDIQNNLHFKDFVEKNKKDFRVYEFEGKYIGITGLENLKL